VQKLTDKFIQTLFVLHRTQHPLNKFKSSCQCQHLFFFMQSKVDHKCTDIRSGTDKNSR